MADVPVGRIIADELRKFPPAVGKKVDSVNLLRDRQCTFGQRSRLAKLTSPVDEGDLADTEYQEGDKRQYRGKCPQCDEHHIPDDKNMVLDKDTDGESLPAPLHQQGDPICSKHDTQAAARGEATIEINHKNGP